MAVSLIRHLMRSERLTHPEALRRAEELQPGAPVWLAENDCFGTKTAAVVKKIHRGGNALVIDLATGWDRQTGLVNLSPREIL